MYSVKSVELMLCMCLFRVWWRLYCLSGWRTVMTVTVAPRSTVYRRSFAFYRLHSSTEIYHTQIDPQSCYLVDYHYSTLACIGDCLLNQHSYYFIINPLTPKVACPRTG